MNAEGVLNTGTVQFADTGAALRLRFSDRTPQRVPPALALFVASD
jgi:hypothetical protein